MSRVVSIVAGCTYVLAVLVLIIYYIRNQNVSVSKLSPDTKGKLFESLCYSFILFRSVNRLKLHLLRHDLSNTYCIKF